MNEPRVPDNNKDWNDIDIYLFSNGQQYSPPRKYHLKSDEIEFWEATVHYLARAQYGSMHSYIDLYTLDGKKIETPLELIDAASYVAVEPPESFIHAGYERYLIKASRSWEKRQEKLAMADTTDELKVIRDISRPAVDELKAIETTNMQDTKIIMEKDLDSIGTNNTIISRLRKENDSSFDEKPKEYKPFLSRKSIDSVKNKVVKKNLQQNSKNNSKDELILSKKRNCSVPKNFKCSSNRRQSIVTKYDKNLTKISSINNPKEKVQPNIPKVPEAVEVKEIIVLSKPSSINENHSHDSSDKGLLITSDVYKNPESEAQSIFIDADRKGRDCIHNHKYKSSDLHKIVELNDDLVNSLKSHKAISRQSIACCMNNQGPEISTSFSSKAKVFNIKLNIEVRDDRESTAIDRSGQLVKCRSYTALLTADQGSQANINITLNDDDYKHNIPKRKSTVSDKPFINSDVTDAKIVVVKCTCGLSEAHNITNKSKDNYILMVPSTFTDKTVESFKCNTDNYQTTDRDSIKSHHSILMEPPNLKSNQFSRDNSQTIIKHKVSICPDSPIKISAHSEIEKHIKNFHSCHSQPKIDQFTQTHWCNVLLQARPEANGHSSFHLPPLRVLAQYNLL